MFKVTKVGDDRLNIEFEGTINSQEMEEALDDFIGKAHGIKSGTMLYEIGEFEFPSFSAICVKLSKIPSLFGFFGKFNKAAIVTDKKWLRKVSELKGMCIPGLQIKAFSKREKPVAEAWLAS